MAKAVAVPHQDPVGSATPRLAPPVPARANLDTFMAAATDLGLELFPWQLTAGRYLQAQGQGTRWLYRHVAIVVARQNGKTTLLVPLIVSRLRMGHRIMHTAQDRVLPREVYGEVAEFFAMRPTELATKNGKPTMPRYANGTEEIRLANGGIYSIVAPSRGGARGPSRDLVIIDELREMHDHDFIAAAGPTTQASESPQMVYLSNAGDDESVVLNGLKASAGEDPTLAYLEWSAPDEVSADDVKGWVQANPSIGHKPGLLENLADDYRTHRSRGTLSIFETENLCRWVTTMRERLVDEWDWSQCRGPLGKPQSPSLAVSLDPDGTQASVALAWRIDDGIAVQLVHHVTGAPVDTDAVGTVVRDLSRRYNAKVGYDPLTDAELAKYARKGKGTSITGHQFAAASAQFALAVASHRIRYQEADAIADDLTWTSRKPDGTDGSYHAVRAKDDHPITASLAAIRASWLASQPKSTGRLVVR